MKHASRLAALCMILAIAPAHAETFKTLYRFTGGADGGGPQAALLTLGAHLYGSATYGGSDAFPKGDGTIFEIDVASGAESTLHTFTGTDGANPGGALVRGPHGNFYGTTVRGGANADYGVVFELDSTGALTVLHTFSGTDGSAPQGALAFTPSGYLWGTTSSGGSSGLGTLFRIGAAGSQKPFATILDFGGRGAEPAGDLLFTGGVPNPDVWGVTTGGGDNHEGTIFWHSTRNLNQYAIVQRFSGSGGARPSGGLATDGAGHFWGTTKLGGSSGYGIVYKWDGNSPQTTVLHSFTGAPDGKFPLAKLMRDSAGNLYGTTTEGGVNDKGTVFEIDAAGNYTILHSFSGNEDGANPAAGLAIGPTGTLYGTTRTGGGNACDCGTVFGLVP